LPVATVATEASPAEHLLAARIGSIYERLPGIAFVNIFNASLIAFVLSREGLRVDVILWLLLVATLATARVIDYRKYRRDEARAEHPEHWARRSMWGSLLSGLLWGGGAILLFTDIPADQWLWGFAIGGMCAGATSLHAAHLPTALSFSMPACLPLLVRLALQGTDQGWAAAMLIVAFLFVTTFTAFRFSAQFGTTFMLDITLQRQTRELDEANRRLKREMEEHRRTSESLHQSQKMEALGSLTGGIAHDFNNLLAVVLGNLDLINRRSQESRVKTLAKSAMEAVESGAALISSLLSFARKQTLRPKRAEINDMIRDFRPLLDRAAGGGVRLEIQAQTAEAHALIDVAQLQAALLNLVINARDATSGDGKIVISTSHVEIDEANIPDPSIKPGAFIRIDVTDDGVGMSANVVAKAFEPFFTTKNVGKGSGLGLSQVYGFALQSGGFASIESAAGAGTRVSLLIPSLGAGTHEAEPHESEAPAILRRQRVLLVDDNSDVLVTLREGLVDYGWEVMIAQDADAALLMLERYRDIELLVADVDMPVGMNGVELVRQAKSRWPDIAAVLISGAAAPADLPADVPFMAKPFQADALVKVISSVAIAA
jgi:signal transduction histidine kinase/CheY-like chemotaxis protein